MAIRARSALGKIKPYVPGRSAEELAAERGVHRAIKLASNENPYGAGAEVKKAIAHAAERTHFYPDGACAALKEKLARRLGVTREHLIVGCGSDEVIRMIAETYLDPGDAAVFADVTFSQYAFACRLMGAREVVVPLRDGVHDLPAMAAAAKKARARVCFVCNPNNPTGTYVDAQEVARFIDEAPEETLLVFDEAYFEYVTAEDFPVLIPLIAQDRRVVVLRTFSKIYGLAGLRVGYGAAPKRIIADLEKVRPPFNVSGPSQAAALAALDDREHVAMSRRENTAQRSRLTEAFRALGLGVLPSQTNFIFVELGRDASEVYESLLDRGVIVRKGAPFGRPDALRITVGAPEENDRLLEAFEEVWVTAKPSESR